MQIQNHGTPCRNFAIMSSEYIPCDPYDGREKFLMASNGHVVFIDTQTLEGEDVVMPCPGTPWDMLFLPEYGKLLIGTCSRRGYLHILDLATRTWEESLHVEGETYIWNMTKGGDGRIYCSDYPGSVLLCYDPEAKTLQSLGRAGKNPANMYARLVHTLPDGNILVSVGLQDRETHLYDIQTGQFRQVFAQGDYADAVVGDLVIVSRGTKTCFYDANTLELLDGPLDRVTLESVSHPAVIAYLKKKEEKSLAHILPYRQNRRAATLKDGRKIGYINQQFFVVENETVRFYNLPVEAPPMGIHGLAVDEKGVVWFAAALGQGMGWYDPKTGEYGNSAATTRAGGEIYGIVPHDGKVFFTAYGGGDHIIYDPAQPWDQYNNVNPKTLQSVAPMKMGRPVGCSVLGPDGNYWTGWCGTYGIYGGGVSRVNAKTYEVDGWFGLVPEQCIGYIAAGKSHIFASSHWMNSGLSYRFDEEFRMLKLDLDCNVVWSETFRVGQFPECIAVVDGRVYLSVRDRLDGMAKIHVYDEETMEKLAVKVMNPLGGPGASEQERRAVRALLAYDDSHLVAFIDERALLLDAKTLETLQTAQVPDMTHLAAMAPDKTVFFSRGRDLYSLRFD